MTAPGSAPAPDWGRLADELQRVMTGMVHQPKPGDPRSGNDFYAEALRRTFGASEPGDDRHRVPYPTVDTRTGLTTVAEADYIRQSHTVVDRLNRERAERERDEARAEARRVYTEARRGIARDLRGWLNERRVSSIRRREGFMIAVDLIDPPARKGVQE